MQKGAKSGKNKTLRESEIAIEEAFKDKIVCRDGNSYNCRCCPLFVTSVKLLARSHAQSCGEKKKLGRRAKVLKCDECGDSFMGKIMLVKHVQEKHTLPQYQCSICLKKYKKRLHYRRHLKIHNNPLTSFCPFCSSVFKFEYLRDRHVTRVHRKKLKAKKINTDENEANIDINQTEEKHGSNFFWQFEVSFPTNTKSSSSSDQFFYNSLGLYSEADWDAWMLSSKLLGLPVTANGCDAGFEIAVQTTKSGAERIVCAGSKAGGAVEDMAETDVDLTEEDLNGEDGGEEVVSGSLIEQVLGHLGEGVIFANGEPGEAPIVPSVDVLPHDESGSVGAVLESSKLNICQYCGTSGFKDRWYLSRHISQMHMDSVLCEICKNVFVDKFRFLQHVRTCFFWCDRDGCHFHDKRESRLEGHKKKHDREV